MVIRRKVFSDKAEKRERLGDIHSHRGLGRSLIIGGPSGAIGGYIGKLKAEDLDDEGKEDHEIIKGASKTAAKVGAGLGAAEGLASFGRYGAGPAVLGSVVGAGRGAAGSYLGARKNAEDRTMKRAIRRAIRRD